LGGVEVEAIGVSSTLWARPLSIKFIAQLSYGRDGGADYGYLASKVGTAGFTIPQPRGIAGSQGNMEGVTLHDLAADIALVTRELAAGKAIVLGHAFGNALERIAEMYKGYSFRMNTPA
jgi:pimeloyl-ACP methyl ester carboxylesterase